MIDRLTTRRRAFATPPVHLLASAGAATVADDTPDAPTLADVTAHLQVANLATYTATPRTQDRRVIEARALLLDFVAAHHVHVDAPMPDVGHDAWMASCVGPQGGVLTAHAPDLPTALLTLWRMVARAMTPPPRGAA